MPRPTARPNTASTVRGGSSGQKARAKGAAAAGKKEDGVKIVVEAKAMEEIKKAIAVNVCSCFQSARVNKPDYWRDFSIFSRSLY